MNSGDYTTRSAGFRRGVKGGLPQADNPLMHWAFLIPFVFFIVVFLVLTTRIHGYVTVNLKVTSVKGLVAFTREFQPMVNDYLRVNWSGQPEDLHIVLKPLLEKARTLAAERGVTSDEDTLRFVLIQILAREKNVKRAQLEAAMNSIEKPAAPQAA